MEENMPTWIEIVTEALNNLGGMAHLSDIYLEVKKLNKRELSKTWEATIRGVIERNSSDSDAFSPKNDIFYSIDGKGNGLWGLRDLKITQEKVDLTEDDINFLEGKLMLRSHIIRERNPKLITIAKEKFKRKNGKLFCEACGFDFQNFYGEIGEDYIEAHHIKPISQIKEEEQTSIEDLVMLCSNCHKMIHRKRPWLTKENLNKLIK
jgi:putative restriction endonuclease